MAVVKFSKQTIEPNPLEVDYWVDITSDPYGSVWKYYNGTDWVSLNLNDGSDDGLSSFDYYTKEQVNSLLSGKADIDSVESKVDDAEFANVIQNIEFREIGDNQMEMVLLKYDNATVGVTIPMASETNPGMLSGESFRDFVKQSQLQSLYDELYQIMSDLSLAEKERNDAEQLRNTSENERIAAETNRFNAENTRQYEEANRATNENNRVVNENNRVTAENNRTTAEQLRAQAEENRASTFNTLEGEMQTTIQEGKDANELSEAATQRANEAAHIIEEWDSTVAIIDEEGDVNDPESDIVNEAIRKTPQTLSKAEQTQARANIGAVSLEENEAFKKTITNQVNNYKPIEINGNVTNAADEEDLTSDENNLLKLKNRNNLNGMGYIILRQNKAFAEQLTQTNTIYEIRYDFNLNGDTVTVPEGCILKFEGGSVDNGTIIGVNTVIQSSLYNILRNTYIKGTFNPVYHVEWFGAHSDISSNQTYINKAIDEINNTDNGGVLIFSGSYEITDTIYLYGKVSLHGTNGYTRSRYKYSKDTSCIKMNFATPDKWAIDVKPLDGYEPIQYNNLAKSDNTGIHEHSRYDIKNLKFAYTNNSCIAYGIIRGINIQGSVFEGLDLSCGSVVGIALIYSVWNLQIQNSVIYADYCGLYIGAAVTQVSVNNVEFTKGLPWTGIVNVNSDYQSLPILLFTTSLPPYTEIKSSAIIAESSAITAMASIFQGWDAIIIGTDYNAFFLHPYIESINKTLGWLYSQKQYSPDAGRKQLVIDNSILGMYSTESYTFGTVRGIIETFNLMCGRYYTPSDETWDYKSYIIHLPPRGTNMASFYYDDFEVVDGKFTNLEVCPYKVLLFSDGDNSEPTVIIGSEKAYNPDYLHTDTTLLYGYAPSAVIFSEFCKRELYPKFCYVQALTDSTEFDGGGYILKDRAINFTNKAGGRYMRVANNPIKIQNCDIIFGKIVGSRNPVLYKKTDDENVVAYFEVYENNNLYFDSCSIYNVDNTTNGAHLIRLAGEKPININIEMTSKATFVGEISPERIIVNPQYEYPYKIKITKGSTRYYFTNPTRPTKGVPIDYEYYDSTIGKYIKWNGSKWIDATGTVV